MVSKMGFKQKNENECKILVKLDKKENKKVEMIKKKKSIVSKNETIKQIIREY